MTTEPFSLLRPYMRPRCGLLAAATLFALGSAGCIMPALGLAPLALQAGEATTVGAINVAGYAAKHPLDDDSTDPMDEDRCDELEIEVPGTIELQLADNSPKAWRELKLGGSIDAPQWQAVAGERGDAAGWRPLERLHSMRFVPPLQNSLTRGKPNYLAYAPAEPRTSVERDQLVALTADFGAGMGRFQWNGRAYQYTLVNRLPCFPGPAVVAK